MATIGRDIIKFIFSYRTKLPKEKYKELLSESSQLLITPIKIIALITAVVALVSMIFEIKYHSELSTQIYFTRFSSIVISLAVFYLMYSKKAPKISIPMVHILLLNIIVSSGLMIYLIPETLLLNAQIVGLMIFISAMFLNWEIKNQIVVAIYYNIVFAFAILFSGGKIYFVPNMFESVLIVLFLSLVSVLASAINFQLRMELTEKSYNIERSEKKFRSIFNNSSEGIFQSSIDGKLLTVNKSLIKLLGYSNEAELMKVNAKDLYKKREERSDIIKRIKEEEAIYSHTVTLKRKDGSDVIVSMNNKIVRDHETNEKYLEGNIFDITPRVKAERQREIVEQKLKLEKEKSDKYAEQALKLSETKSRFLANMSHELRTPANGIIGFLTLLESGAYKNEDEQKQFIKTAKQSAESLIDVLNSILDLSKIEAGKIELDHSPFNMANVIDKSVHVILPKLKEKNLEIETSLPEYKKLNFLGDAIKIRQVFVNLLGNAVKFTMKGKISISLTIDPLADEQTCVNVRIKDSGIGIPAEKIDELFKPFSQVDGSEGLSTGGTGLGLVICKEFINLMGGEIFVFSNEGEGTEFTFTLCLNKLSEDHADFEIEKQEPVFDEPDSEQSIKFKADQRKVKQILLAEDNPVNQKVVIKTLEAAGYKVEPVFNGKEALDALQKNSFDLVLMDIQMPDMDGYTAARMIRENENSDTGIPIIALTAHAMMGDKEKCIEAGMNDYISKPIISSELLNKIDHLVAIKVKEEPVTETDQKEALLFDVERLNQVTLGDKNFEKELLTDYLNDTDQKLDDLREQLFNKEIKKITDTAHTLKGSSYSVGARLIGDEAYGIELSAKINDLASVEERLIKLNKAVIETRKEIKELI